jgi:hypothetical protein
MFGFAEKSRPLLNNSTEARCYRTASGSERDQGTTSAISVNLSKHLIEESHLYPARYRSRFKALHLIEESHLYPARYRSRFCNVRRSHFKKDQVLCPSDWIHPLLDGAEKPAAGADFHAHALLYFSCPSARDLSFAGLCQTFRSSFFFMLQS